MKQLYQYGFIVLSLIGFTLNTFEVLEKNSQKTIEKQEQSSESFKSVLIKHLKAVRNKDLVSLKATMSPKGNMELILPSSETLYSVDKFMAFHKEWFSSPNWTFEAKILSTNSGKNIAVATTEVMYKEPNRNGKAYFNRMIVSYTLEKIDGKWYIIKDHASSIEKTAN